MRISFCSNNSALRTCSHGQFQYYIDPYIGHQSSFAYFTNSHCSKTRWNDEIKIQRDICTKLRKELDEIEPQTILIGYNTDPYQVLEDSLCQTRIVLEVLLEKGFSVNIHTKSNLVKRDFDILKRMPASKVCLSVASNDDNINELFDFNTLNKQHRNQALHEIKAQGVKTSVKIGPVIPKISDPKTVISKIKGITDEIELTALSFKDKRGEDWIRFEEILYKNYLESAEDIETILFSKDHVYWQELKVELEKYRKDHNLNLSVNF